MQENEVLEEHVSNDPTGDAPSEKPKLKRNGVKDEFKKKGEELDKEQRPPMSKEDTVKFYEENIPFMKLQDEYEEYIYRFNERKVKSLELQVRELEAIGFLGQWKAQQDEAKRRHDQETKMKEEWDAMTDGQKEEYKQKAKANIRVMELQAKGSILYTGENAGDVMSFMTGELHQPIIVESSDKKFCIQIPDGQEKAVEICMLPGQTLTRTEAGEFIVTQE